MAEREVMMDRMTRREFREGLENGNFQTAIIPTGANEQHLEHLTTGHDIRHSTHIAREAAMNLHPQVAVTVPMNVGISEHHMVHKGTITAKPGSWLSVLFDAAESVIRHGCKNVLILNGHGGNVAPVKGILGQWQLYFKLQAPDTNLHFCSYWDLIPEDFAHQHLKTKRYPGHAQEFETATALALFPDSVRVDAMNDQEDKEPLEATAEAGQALVDEAISQVTAYVKGMIEGGRSDDGAQFHP
jgi:creatinine amidohydrolase